MEFISLEVPLLSALSATFDLKDLGPLNYFLGIQITPTKYGLTLS